MATNGSNSAGTHSKEVRLLLFLWDLGGADVNKGKLNERLKRKGEKTADYQDTYKRLENAGAIAISKNKISLLMPKGLQILGEGLKSDEFHFDNAIGAKAANALLKWIREYSSSASGGGNGGVVPTNAVKASESAIASYDEFKQVALKVYDQLNRDYNLDDLVPIYRIRREIGDRVSRSQFSEWMLEMQANDIFQLMGGEMPDITPDKREDSIETPVGGLRYYAKCLIS